MDTSHRPLSPHLQVYRLPLTAIISVTHRMTGVCLAFGLLAMPFVLMWIASGPEAYAAMQAVIDTFLGKLVLFGYSYALFFHLCHGIRHLFWDAGYGFEHDQLDRLVKIELAASVGLTLLVWVFARFI